MKTKSFQKYLEQRLNKNEIATIEAQAALEVRYLQTIQKMISDIMNDYMKINKIGFNDLVRKLDWSPSKVAKIQKGEANITLASLAHLCALLGKDPHEIFKRSR
ncbi:MAG TPA: helix-turn-helix domain-containing protein [Candidatus Babeliales bacterium]|nr:helix-turn-helix domain-containing protein [Candidatus Babeliales bacterium]